MPKNFCTSNNLLTARLAMATDDDEWRTRIDRKKNIHDLYVWRARDRRVNTLALARISSSEGLDARPEE